MLLEERMMKLNENKVRQGLEALNQDLMELRRKDMEVNEKLREERTDLESRRELYASQSRCSSLTKQLKLNIVLTLHFF